VVRLSLLPMDFEDSSKLWTALFPSSYRLSIAYQATVVLIEGPTAPVGVPTVKNRTIGLRPSAALPPTAPPTGTTAPGTAGM
jgi:hypothetical protein